MSEKPVIVLRSMNKGCEVTKKEGGQSMKKLKF